LKLSLADDFDGQLGSRGVARLDDASITPGVSHGVSAVAHGDFGLAIGREMIANEVAVMFFSGESVAHHQAVRQVGVGIGFEI
jgi:hypothetical protein